MSRMCRNPGRTDLYVLKHHLGYDLAVSAEAVSFDPENPAPGSEATISALVENRGDLPVEGVTTRFYLGDPDDGGTLIGEATISEALIPGDAQPAQVSWPVPQEPATHLVTVVVDPALVVDDPDRSNNAAGVSVLQARYRHRPCGFERYGAFDADDHRECGQHGNGAGGTDPRGGDAGRLTGTDSLSGDDRRLAGGGHIRCGL